jgi:hypothetical protein
MSAWLVFCFKDWVSLVNRVWSTVPVKIEYKFITFAIRKLSMSEYIVNPLQPTKPKLVAEVSFQWRSERNSLLITGVQMQGIVMLMCWRGRNGANELEHYLVQNASKYNGLWARCNSERWIMCCELRTKMEEIELRTVKSYSNKCVLRYILHLWLFRSFSTILFYVSTCILLYYDSWFWSILAFCKSVHISV